MKRRLIVFIFGMVNFLKFLGIIVFNRRLIITSWLILPIQRWWRRWGGRRNWVTVLRRLFSFSS